MWTETNADSGQLQICACFRRDQLNIRAPSTPSVRVAQLWSMSSESLRTVRDRFSEFIERVQKHHERVVVTRNGTPAAVLVSPEDLESLEETLAVLEDSEAVADLVAAHRAYLEGDVVRGIDAVRALRPGE